jgi:hypothetical protein
LAAVRVTLSAPDVGYVVWEQQPGTRLRLSVVCNGEIVVSDRQLLSDAVPLALSSRSASRRLTDFFAWSFLRANSPAQARAPLLDHGGWWNTGRQTLASANNGWYLITWTHANRNSNPQLSIRAALGHTDRVGPSLVAVSSRRHTTGYVGATDGHGDAIILFNGSTDTGDGAPWPYASGLYTTLFRH